MGINAYVSGWQNVDYHTEDKATAIVDEVQGSNGKRLALVGFDVYAGDTTAGTLSVMYAGGTRTTISSIVGDSIIKFGDSLYDPGAAIIANGDEVAYQLDDGTWEFNTVDSLAGDSVLFDAAIGDTTTVTSGNRAVVFGVVGDGACYNFYCAGGERTYGYDAVFCTNKYTGDPLRTSFDNGDTGRVNNLVFAYVNK